MPNHRKPGRPHSDFPGVRWDEKSSKWLGVVLDRSVRVGKRAKTIHVGLFDDERACADAVAAKQAEVDAAIAAKLHAMAQERPHTRGLPLRPAHAADAEPDTAYYGEKFQRAKGSELKEFGPTRLVRVASKSRPGGFAFLPCCIATLDSGAPCTSVASKDGKHCNRHGGGFRVGEATGNGFCTHCKTMALWAKRQPQHGGNGLCPACETQLKREAAANGHDGPVTSQRWEDVVFDQLLPLVTYSDGTTPFPPDQRDERKGGGLGTSSAKKRRRECDTTTNRFPDGLWILRDEHGRALLVITVEVDEDSHVDRDSECETGKVEDTFQSVQERCKHEGAATGSAGRVDGTMIPVVVFRFNPNAYDKAKVKLEDRIRVLANLVNSYAHLDAEAIAKLQTHAPILHVLYYHSKEGGKHLAHYASKAVEAGWAYTVH